MRRAIEEGLVDVGHSIEVGLRGSIYEPPTGPGSGRSSGSTTSPPRMSSAWVQRPSRPRSAIGWATGPAFISFDIDVIDPAYAPGTGTPEAGGPSARDLLAILRGLTGIDFVGFDVVEVIPAYDPAGQTATLAANLAYEMLSLVALRRLAGSSPA